MNLSTSIYRICALLLFFISSQAPLYAMEQSTGPDYFSWLPKDVILIVTNLLLPEINPSFDVTENSSDLIANLSAAIVLSKSNKYFNSLLSPKITKYKNMINEAANAYDDKGDTPLSRAIEKADIPRILKLIKSGADVNKPNKEPIPMTPLYIATDLYDETAAIQITQILLEHGADVNAPNNDIRIFPPFCNVLRNTRLDLVKLFIEYGVNLHIPPNKGWTETPLQVAIRWNHRDQQKRYTAAIDLITQALELENPIKKQKNN